MMEYTETQRRKLNTYLKGNMLQNFMLKSQNF